MDILRRLKEIYQAIAGTVLLSLGGAELRLGTLVYLAVLIVLPFWVTARLRRWIVYRLLAGSAIEVGVREPTGSIVRYLIVAVGLLVILQTAGIDLTTLNVVAGAVGIGVGFGLQNVEHDAAAPQGSAGQLAQFLDSRQVPGASDRDPLSTARPSHPWRRPGSEVRPRRRGGRASGRGRARWRGPLAIRRTGGGLMPRRALAASRFQRIE